MMVFVDNMNAHFRGMIMCHLMAETTDELDAFAKKLGLRRKWRQAGSWNHYDICLSMKKQAIAAGAREVTTREMVMLVREWREKNTAMLEK